MTPPRVRIATVSKAEPKTVVATELGLPRNLGERELLFETVRAVAWASTLGRHPVVDHTLLDRATSSALSYLRQSPIDVRSRISDAVDALESIGDLTRIPRGRWICTPAHVVAAPEANQHLLISGLPLRALPAPIRENALLRGPARYVQESPAAELPVISTATWQRKPEAPLAAWTDHVIRGQVLSSPDPELVTTGTYTFYLPARSTATTPQRSRWRPTDPGLSGRQLTRIRSVNGTLSYNIVQMKDGAVIEAKEIDHDTARRLMYGIDLESRRPTEAISRHAKDGLTISVSNPLPRAEFRSLTARAIRLDRNRWVLPESNALSFPELADLGIELVESR